jgi:DMSO/TMAO reductase YedYZ heme-binding membrane subunit
MAAVWLDALGANPAEALIRSLGEWALRFLCLALLVTPVYDVNYPGRSATTILAGGSGV